MPVQNDSSATAVLRHHLDGVAPGTIRRTTTVDSRADGEWSNGSILSARGRDLVVDAEGLPRTHATHQIAARTDATGALHGTPGGGLPPELDGLASRRGFRRELAAYLGSTESSSSTLLAALLDDIPGMAIISGYAQLYETDPALLDQRSSPGLGICTGFRAGGHASTSNGAVANMLANRPPAPQLVGTDERVWHDDPPMVPGAMRRRRMVDVTPGDPTRVAAYFRDVYLPHEGGEVVLHEYEVVASLAGSPLSVVDVQATPGALPLADCPGSVVQVGLLVGAPLQDLDAEVRRRLTGPQGCTHLNDTLRALRAVDHLTTAFREATDPRTKENN